MQDGVVGLLRALERYDPALGTPFWAYARWWVRQAMQQLVAELARPVVLSDRAARELARVKAAQRSHLQAHGREPSSRELAESTGLDRAQVDDLMAAERPPRGLEGGASADALADQRAEEAFERVPRRLSRAELAGLLGGLPHRECEIVRARFGLDGRERRTLRELGGELGVSAERVRQIEERALERLRETVEA
jgi:RNA polymerase sigma factor (sigma-70 family)